jgi:hypothetical protein
MTTDPVIVTMAHVRQAKQCRKGARAFFDRHGLDWDKFRTEGLPAELIESTGDAMAMRVVEIARG